MKKILFLLFCLFFSSTILAQWQPDVRLTNDPNESATSLNYARCIASSGEMVHVVWYDGRNGATQFYYKRSTNGGTTWGPDTRLTTSNTYAERGGIAVNGQTVHVVWQDWRNPSYEIYYIRSTDAGSSWGQEIRLTNASGASYAPNINVTGSTVHVFWTDLRDGNPEAYYKKSTDAGLSWGQDIRLTNNSAESWYPTGAVSGSTVHVFWTDLRDGYSQVYYKRSTDGGINWGVDTRLVNTTFASSNPAASSNGPNVHVVWYDTRDGNWEIYYKKSTNDGITWGNDTRLTNASGESYTPTIDVSGSLIHVIWEDTRNGDREIYYKRSINNGTNWETDTRLTNSTGESHYPSICYSGPILHAVWFDERDGNREIYYKRNPTGNIVSPPLAPVLVSPPNSSFNQPTTVRFIWNKPASAVTYRIQVALDSMFSNMVYNDSTLTDSTIVVANLLTNKYYWWHVNAKNSYGTSPYSLIWKFGTFPVGLKELNGRIPDNFELYNNFPNPFNPVSKIKFDIAKTGNTKLTVFDILGIEVAVLVNHRLMPGVYETEFNGENFPSGIYFYRFETESFVQTKKMMLIK